MIKHILMDDEYCSMGRWISVVIANKLGTKLYEAKKIIEKYFGKAE
jgi:hypothetical protein